MPALTPNQNYPYPLDSDLIDVAGNIEDLAKAIDLDVEAVQDGLATKVSKTGDTMTGMLSLPSTAPTSLNHAITKGWADSNYVNDKGDSMQGALDMQNHKITGLPAPADDSDAVRKGYVDKEMLDAIRKSVSGPGNQTMQSGLRALRFVILDDQEPSGPWHATPKNYVDEKISALNPQNYVQVDGDTMTGKLTIGNNPQLNEPGIGIWPSGHYRSTVEGGAPNGNMVLSHQVAGFEEGSKWISFNYNVDDICGTIHRGSSLNSVVYSSVSDMRLKERVGPITDAATRVRQLAARAFRGHWWDSDEESDMICAQDVATVAPYAVSGTPDGMRPDGRIDPMQVDYMGLVPLLVSALGSALDKIEALEVAISQNRPAAAT